VTEFKKRHRKARPVDLPLPDDNILDVAEYCINYFRNRHHKLIDVHFLMKVMYFIQAVSLAERNRPCFSGEIVAAQHGPIMPALVDLYMGIYGSFPLEVPIKGLRPVEDAESKALIERICDVCVEQNYDFEVLSLISHMGTPWSRAWNIAQQQPDKNEISNEALDGFYGSEKGLEQLQHYMLAKAA